MTTTTTLPDAPPETAPASVLGEPDGDLLRTTIVLQLLLQRAV